MELLARTLETQERVVQWPSLLRMTEQKAEKPCSVSPETRQRDLRPGQKTESDVVTFLTELIEFESTKDVAKLIDRLTPKQWKRLLSLVRGDIPTDLSWKDAMDDFLARCPEWQQSPPESKAVLFDRFPDHAYMRVVRVQSAKMCAGHAVVVALHMQKCILGPADAAVCMPDLSDLYVKLNATRGNSSLVRYLRNYYSLASSAFLQSAYGIRNRFKDIYRLVSASCEERLMRQRADCELIMERLRTRPAILSFMKGSDFHAPGKLSYDGTPTVETESLRFNYKEKVHTVVLVGARRSETGMYFMAQNFWASKQFVEFSVEYLALSEATITFIKDSSPLDLITPLRQQVGSFAGQSVETAPGWEDSDDEDFGGFNEDSEYSGDSEDVD